MTCIVDLKRFFEKFGLLNTVEKHNFINDIIQNHESSTEEFLDIQRNILEEYNRRIHKLMKSEFSIKHHFILIFSNEMLNLAKSIYLKTGLIKMT